MAVWKSDLETRNYTAFKYLAFRVKQVLKNSHLQKLRFVNMEEKVRIFIVRYIRGANPCRGMHILRLFIFRCEGLPDSHKRPWLELLKISK